MALTTPSPTTLHERDAAAYIGRRPSALRLWRVQGRGPAYVRQGRAIVYLVSDLDAYLQRHRVETSDSRIPQEVA